MSTTQENAAGKTADISFEEQQDGSVVVPVEDLGEQASNAQDAGAANETQAAADQRVVRGGDDDDDEHHEGLSEAAELQQASTDAEREAIRERRRLQRAENKERRRQGRQRTEAQLLETQAELRRMQEQFAELNSRINGSDLAQLDQRLAAEQQAITYLQSVIADAVKTQNGDAAADAMTRLQQATQNASRLSDLRRQMATAPQRTQPSAGTRLDPRAISLGNKWLAENPWYNPRENSTETAIVLAIDSQLSREGYDPTTEGYWEELTERASRHVRGAASGGRAEPNDRGGSSYNGGAAPPRRPVKSVVTGSGREGSSASSGAPKSGYVLSAERVKALKDAGHWEDPKLRNEAIRRYRDYDASAAREAAGRS